MARSAQRELVLDRYALLERLGTGGHGTVWLAHDERLHRDVAVKRLPRGGAGMDSREERRRAAREALAAARLSHPAIVALYEAGADDDAYYLVSEVVHGETLADRFAAADIGDREIVRIGIVLAEALSHAHQRGVFHRDVKPQNAIVPLEPSDAAPVKLTDFGVARIAGEAALTRTGDVIGTLAYMAPEQADGHTAGAESDLYSLALTLYEGLCGENPIRGRSPADTARRIGSRIPSLQRARPDLPVELCAALDCALNCDPARRGALADLHAALVDALPQLVDDDDGESARSPAPRRIREPRTLAPLQHRERLAAALGAAALGACAIASGVLPAHGLSPAWGAAVAGLAVAVAPRAGFAAAGAGATGWLLFDGRPGAAAVLLLALLPLFALLRATPWLWSLPALAVALGFAAIAGAFPGLAARFEHGWTRFAAGALGAWWLLLAEPLLGRTLLFGSASAPAGWRASFPDAVAHVLVPLFSSAAVALVLVWGLAALVAPWVVRGAEWPTRALGAIVWGTLLAAATGAVAVEAGHAADARVLAGAALAALLAALPSRVQAPSLRSMA